MELARKGSIRAFSLGKWVLCFGITGMAQPASALRIPAPQTRPSTQATAPNKPKVELIRDHWGVPHLFAKTDRAALFGLGYATAEDRGFQMHFKLRIAKGRLAETVGILRHGRKRWTTLDNDRKMRTFGFARKALEASQRLDPHTRALLQAYSDGVNTWFREHPKERHPLFARFGLEPETWTPADCILSWWYLGQFFATDGTRDFLAWRNRGRDRFSRAGPQMAALRREAAKIKPLGPDNAAAVVQRSDVSEEWIQEVRNYLKAMGFAQSAKEGAGDKGRKFSHAWVVGGKKTTTGSTLLVSDPQTRVTNPSLFYEYHIKGGTFNARGIGVPGCPMLLIGFTRDVAWGVTALGADQADLFRLHSDRAHPGQYRLDGKWLPLETRTETIKVRGGEEVSLQIRESRFGPIVNAFAFTRPGEPLVAVKRIPLWKPSGATLRAGFAMMRARNAQEFYQAISGWRFPSTNILFGDRKGDIGYSVQGALPIRSPLALRGGRYAHDGSASKFDWKGILPFRFLPHVLNPKRGYLYSGNHLPIASFYPANIGISTGSMGHSLRSWRLSELLATQGLLTPKNVFGMHNDCVNPARREIVHLGLHCTENLGFNLSPESQMALLILGDWFRNGASSDLRKEGAALATKIPLRFRVLNTPLTLRYGGGLSGLSRWLRAVKERLAKDPKAKVSKLEVKFVDELLSDAWEAALTQYGQDFKQWGTKARASVLQRPMPYEQSLEGFPGLDPKEHKTLPALFCVDGSTIQSQASQSYSQMVNLADVDRSLSILPPGQSEKPQSPLRFSTWKLWKEAKLHPAPLSRAEVNKIQAKQTDLVLPGQARRPVPSSPPNIVLILADDLGWKDTGYQGSKFYLTPNIDQLAREGMAFDQAYSNGPNCAPSRASLMTGQYPPRHGIYTVGSAARGKAKNRYLIPVKNRRALPPSAWTIAEALKAKGYKTAAMGKWHLGKDPRSQGFDINIGGTQAGHPRSYFSPYKNPSLPDGPKGEYLTDRLTKEALAFLDANKKRPFFLYLSHFAVHTPLQSKKEKTLLFRERNPDGRHRNPVYAGMIASLDESVGKVLKHLDKLGLSKNTLVLFCSDNGGLGTVTDMSPLRGMKGMLYEGGIRIPFIARWPGHIQAGTQSHEAILLSDLFPTLLELAHIPKPKAKILDGVSLLPLFLGKKNILPPRPLFWHFPAYLEGNRRTHGSWRTTPVSMVRMGRFKLLEFFEGPRLELYDLSKDLSEQKNLSDSKPKLRRRLLSALLAWQKNSRAFLPLLK